jgi:hypothetical protein
VNNMQWIRQSSSRLRGRVLMTVALLLGSALAFTAVVAATEEEELAPPAPERYAEAEGRYQAALADQAQETMRIEEATASYAAAHATASLEPRNYLVSFAQPVRALSILQGWEILHRSICCPPGSKQLGGVFSWALADDGIHPTVGHHLAEEIGWPGAPGNVDATLQRLLLNYLVQRSESISQAIQEEGNDPDDQEALSAQASENAELQAAVSAEGVFLYGLTCTCSPISLDFLAAEVPGLVLRAVEVAELGYQFPIAPTDPLRQRVIETRGRYGR